MTKSSRPELILASASSRRLQLLRQAGIEPDAVEACDIDETPKKSEAPPAYVKRLAAVKAQTISNKHVGALVLAADTAVAVGTRILGQPQDKAEAEQFLKLLSGRRHRVITSVALITLAGKLVQKNVTTVVSFKRLTDEEIAWYLKSGEWQGKAGGYAIQGKAGAFVNRINGSYTNVVGLPLYETCALLTGNGFRVTP